mmetsp:Transcript_42049/g.129939  ORF Transcript_42049/g.129939 Transcript_42049/m.129939 type:complete len:293 (-) Transcript_42049:17-895(-)
MRLRGHDRGKVRRRAARAEHPRPEVRPGLEPRHRRGLERRHRPDLGRLQHRAHHGVVERVLLQVRVRAARVRGGHRQLRVAAAELVGEDEVGELAVAVARPGVVPRGGDGKVERPGGLQVARPRHERRDIDDARRIALLQRRQQAAREREVPEVVGAHLLLEAVGRLLPLRHHHHARVVHEDVQRRAALVHRLGHAGHVGKRREVPEEQLERRLGRRLAQIRERRLGAPLVTAHEQHRGAAQRELQRGVVSDAAVGARDERRLPGKIRDVAHSPRLEQRLHSAHANVEEHAQ